MVTLDRRYWVWDLVLLVALAGVLRFHQLDQLSFYYDEAENALVAREYIETGRFQLPSGRLEPNGLTYKWITAEMFQWFGESEKNARIPAAVFGILTTAWIYLWGSHWFGPWTGRIAAFLFAVWPWSVTWGRIGRFYSLQQFLFVLLVVCVWKMLECNALGHPVAEPPRVAGRRNPFLTRMLRLVPFAVLVLLSVLTSATAVLSIAFLPMYLLVRLVWTWSRGRLEDAEFHRSVRYIAACIAACVIPAILLYWIDPRAVIAGLNFIRIPQDPLYYLRFFRENFGLVFVAAVAVGSGMAWAKRRGGWLVFCAFWAPVLVHSLMFSHHRDRFIFYAFPFCVMLAALPVAWAVQRLADYFNHVVSLRSMPGWREVLAVLAIALVGINVTKNTLFAERGTAAIVGGSEFTFARETADWRALASVLKEENFTGTIISTDAIPAYYYFGRLDYIFPNVEIPGETVHPHTGTTILPDAEALAKVLQESPTAVIVGTARKFEQAASRSREANLLWAQLLEGADEVWKSPGDSLEILIRWRKNSPI